MDFDKVLTEIGEFGKYQKFVLILLCIPACIMNAYNGYSMVFLAYTPDHKCAFPQDHSNETYVKLGKCHVEYLEPLNRSIVRKKVLCSQWTYDENYFEETIITKWDLVCDQAIKGKIMISVMLVCTVVGCLCYSYIQDRWGRKVAFLINLTTYLVGSLASIFMPTLVSFTAVRTLAAINGIATWNICYIWALEYTGPSKRTLVTTVMCVAYAIGNMSLALIAFVCRTWLQVGIVIAVPFVVLFSYQWLVLESPRWLLSKGKDLEAKIIVKKMVKLERKRLPANVSSALLHHLNQTTEITPLEPETPPITDTAETGTVVDLFRGQTLRRKTILVTLGFVANAVVYTSMAYNTENLGGNLYITYTAQSAVEAPATLLNLLILNRYGRVLPVSIGMILAGICCLLTAPVEYIGDWAVIVVAVIGKFCICMTYAIIYQLGGELFPTVVRGLGIGFASVIGDGANVMMPYIVHSSTAYKLLPMIIMGLVAITGGSATLFLPETLGQHMPETLNDAETHGKVEWATFKLNMTKLSGGIMLIWKWLWPSSNNVEES